MKIYLAGPHSNGRLYRDLTPPATPNLLAPRNAIRAYPDVLESYHYMRPDMLAVMREQGRKIFLDSGAYTMHTQGVKIDLAKYAGFIRDNADVIRLASNLDDVTKTPRISYENQKRLEDLGAKVCPVYHIGDNDGIFKGTGAAKAESKGEADDYEYLQRYLDEGYDYIFIGGLVPESTETLRIWFDEVFDRFFVDSAGRPKVKLHGFGLTTIDLMLRYPWESVDSTSWVMTGSYGGIYLDLPRWDGTTRDVKVDFSSKSNRQRDANSLHYRSLPPRARAEIDVRLAELEAQRQKDPELEAIMEREFAKAGELIGIKQGINAECLAASYGWRDVVNIGYFARMAERATKAWESKRWVRPQPSVFS